MPDTLISFEFRKQYPIYGQNNFLYRSLFFRQELLSNEYVIRLNVQLTSRLFTFDTSNNVLFFNKPYDLFVTNTTK